MRSLSKVHTLQQAGESLDLAVASAATLLLTLLTPHSRHTDAEPEGFFS